MKRNADCKDCTLRSGITKTVCLSGAYYIDGNTLTLNTDFIANYPPNHKPTIMLVGLNPNPLEDAFNQAGRGDFKQILEHFTDKVNIYYTNLTKCRSKDKINIKHLRACSKYFDEEYNEVKPAAIVALGDVVRKHLLGDTSGKTITRGAGYKSDKYGYVIPTHDGLTLYKKPWVASEIFTDLFIAAQFATTKRVKATDNFYRNSFDVLSAYLVNNLVTKISVDIETDGKSTDDTLDPTKSWPWILTLTCVDSIDTDTHFLFDKIAFDEGMWDEVGNLLSKKAIPIIGQNFKFDLKFLRFHCIGWDEVECSFDTQIAHHIVNENTGHSLNHLEWRYLPEHAGHKGEVDLSKLTAHEHDQQILESYALQDTISAALIAEKLEAALPDCSKPLVKMLSKASSVLASTEAFGCRVDYDKLTQQLAEVGSVAFELEDQLREYTTALGVDEFNPNSPTQVQSLLYRTLKLPTQYGDDGFVSTDDVALEILLEATDSDEQLTLVQALRAHRDWEKQRSTLVGIKDRLYEDPSTSMVYIRTEYQMSFVVTGRMSSRNPNLQNIPKAGAVKQIFIPRPGKAFVEADYKQAEYRIAAQMAQDAKMLAVLAEGADFHQITVEALAQLQCVVTRDAAKTINFAILYGAGDKKVATLTKLPLDQVQFIQRRLKDAFPDFARYFEQLPELARRQGNKFTGLFGRVRTIPYLNATSNWWRYRGERQIVNSPVQGAASDLTLNAIVNVNDAYKNTQRPFVALTVHDSIIWEVNADKALDFSESVKSHMERQSYPDFNLHFDVPIQADIQVKTTSWGEKEVKL